MLSEAENSPPRNRGAQGSIRARCPGRSGPATAPSRSSRAWAATPPRLCGQPQRTGSARERRGERSLWLRRIPARAQHPVLAAGSATAQMICTTLGTNTPDSLKGVAPSPTRARMGRSGVRRTDDPLPRGEDLNAGRYERLQPAGKRAGSRPSAVLQQASSRQRPGSSCLSGAPPHPPHSLLLRVRSGAVPAGPRAGRAGKRLVERTGGAVPRPEHGTA